MKRVLAAAAVVLCSAVMNAQTTVTVNGAAPSKVGNAALTLRKYISPYIYGVAFADAAQLADLNATLNRSGGNATSRYNWSINATNRGADWFFESLSDGSATAGALGDEFITATRAGGAEPILTVPMVGWVAKLGPGRERLASYSIAKYGAQTANDWQWFPDAGNGIAVGPPQTKITWNDKNDANIQADQFFQLGWIQHLVSQWGRSETGGVQFYCLDNEPSIWHEAHRDVHPTGATMTQVKDKIIAYAAMVRSIDPDAKLLALEEWGWSGYFYSGYDLQYAPTTGWTQYPDRDAHGGADYVPWVLDQLRLHDAANDTKSIDYFTLHYYPQGGEFDDDDDAGSTDAMRQLRNRSTRSLWDTTYVDESWIGASGPDGGIVRLIPRMKQWVANNYPGLKIGITEYNWGGESGMNGATAQADILGILGREGVDMATRWTTPASTSPVYKAFKMYRNYDGELSTFGEFTVPTTTNANPDDFAAFGAVRGNDGAVTVMLVNKSLTGTRSTSVTIQNHDGLDRGKVWRLANNTITEQAEAVINSGTFNLTLPAQSVTLVTVGTIMHLDPTITSWSPRRGNPGTQVRIEGERLISTFHVSFNGTPASFTIQGDAASNFEAFVLATVPAGAETGEIRIYNEGGSVAVTPFVVCDEICGAPRHDFNKDGNAEVLWRSQTSGQNAMWFMNGTTVAGGAYLPTVEPSMTVAGTGDFDGDGDADIFWRNASSGQNAIWFMQGSALSAGMFINSADIGLTVAGIGDLDGNGKSDIVWRHPTSGINAVWLMNGSSIAQGAFLPTVDSSMQIATVEDINGDGRVDILFRNGTTGENALWMMNGANIQSSHWLPSAEPAWTVAGAGDLNGDGFGDIIWRKPATGTNAAWLMTGSGTLGSGSYLPDVNVEVHLAAVGDFDGDGNSDLMWRHQQSGSNAMWLMNGTTIATGNYLPDAATTLDVVAPK